MSDGPGGDGGPVAPREAASQEAGLPPTVAVWNLLLQPANPWAAAEALLGLSQGAAHMLAGMLLLSSPEAEALLAAMPGLSRSLSMGTTSRPERSVGEVRGPILWSETLAARAASANDQASFVYTVASRAYDTAENRVLVGALRALADAGRTVDTRALRDRDTDLARLINARTMDAIRWLEHRALVDVSLRPVHRRQRQRAKSFRRRQYRPALELMERAEEPLTGEDLALVADTRTRAQHRAIAALVNGLRQRGVLVPPLTVHRGELVGGPLTYVHERSRRGRTGAAGIRLGDRSIDVPAVVEGRMIRVGAAPEGDLGPAHLFLGSTADVDAVLDAAGF
jgi:hypothetical protein